LRLAQAVPDGIDVRHAGPDQTLAAMLEEGEIDALLSVDVPESLIDGSTDRRIDQENPAPLPRLRTSGTRLLPAHRHLPDDARDRHPS
jgi:hypothetical protein